MLERNRTQEAKRGAVEQQQLGSESSGSGAGMINVHRRLVLEYGPGYGLQIGSEENAGTTVTVVIPVLKPQREEEGAGGAHLGGGR